MAAQLDDLDRKILAELQDDAEQSLDEIARKVGSSKTPVWNRIRRMREQGVIIRQTALLDAESLGLEACFFVLIRTSEHEAEWQHRFLKALRERPEVLEAHRLAGRVSGDSTVAYAWAYAMAAESATGCAIPARASWLRALLLERERVANHLGDQSTLKHALQLARGSAVPTADRRTTPAITPVVPTHAVAA